MAKQKWHTGQKIVSGDISATVISLQVDARRARDRKWLCRNDDGYEFTLSEDLMFDARRYTVREDLL